MKHCTKCGKKAEGDSKYCGHCGTELKNEESITKKVKKEINKDIKEVKKEVENVEEKVTNDLRKGVKILKHVKFIIITIIILVLATLFIPTKTYWYEVEVPYQDTEYYTETVPYNEEEQYEVQVPYESTETYTDQVPVERDVPYTAYESYYDYTTDCDAYVRCSCLDTSFWTGKCIKCLCERPVTKYRKEVGYESVQKTRPVTKYKTETKTRTVTKYRDEQKSRIVTKIGTERRNMEINWLFGFEMPWVCRIPYLSY